MNVAKFVKRWEWQRRKGKSVYVIRNCILLLLAQNLGLVLGSLITHRPAFAMMQNTSAYVCALLFLVLVNVIITIHLWNVNDRKFKRLTDSGMAK